MSARSMLVLLTTAAVAVTAAPAAAQQPAVERTVTAVGNGVARVRPADRHDNASIRKAVNAAKRKVLPRALADARRDAGRLAAGSGLALGEIVAVAETPPAFSFYDDTAGFFGPGRYCGRIRVSVLRRINGERRRVVRTRRVCRFPSSVTTAVSVTYAATPAQ